MSSSRMPSIAASIWRRPLRASSSSTAEGAPSVGLERLEYQGEPVSEDQAGGEGEHPGVHDLTADAPVDRGEPSGGTHAHDRRADGVGGAERDAETRPPHNLHPCATLGG